MRHIVGITRFALQGPMGEGEFSFPHRKKPAKYETKRAWVYSPGYLRHRLALWKALALPSVEAIEKRLPPGYVYTHLVAVNPDLPIRTELEQSFTSSTQQIAEIETSLRLEKGLAPLIDNIVGPHDYFTFRLDDDDALCAEYVDMVVAQWEHGHAVITPTRGFYIGIKRSMVGEPLRVVPASNPGSPHGIGAFNAHIHALGKHNAIPGTVGIADRVYWLRSVHRSNVTLAGHAGTAWGASNADVAPAVTLERFFPHLSLPAVTEALRQDPI
jgi:hypothetical protein